MLYQIGTYIDLQYMNESSYAQEPATERRFSVYDVGTKILFVKNLSEQTVLKITPKLLVINQPMSA